MSTSDSLRSFGMSGFLITNEISKIEETFSISLGHVKNTYKSGTIADSLSLFEPKIQHESADMAFCYQLFYCLEKSIRDIITNNLGEKVGQSWWESDRVPQVLRDAVKSRRSAEIDSGFTQRSDNLIDFTTFGELENLITKNWDIFQTIFESQRAVQRIMHNLNLLRGPIAHCCPLSDDEKDRLILTVKDWFRQL